LKRGLLVSSEVRRWIEKCIQDYQIEPKDVSVKLLNEEHQPLLAWNVVKAYPTKWAVSDFNAGNNAVVIETLQLTYQYFTLQS
jgi:phage tail-like protein